MKYFYEHGERSKDSDPINLQVKSYPKAADQLTRPNPGDFTDSVTYGEALRKHSESVRARKIEATQGCLSQEVRLNGINSGTPTTCPVEGCEVTANRGALRLDNQEVCLTPLVEAEPKYPWHSR